MVENVNEGTKMPSSDQERQWAQLWARNAEQAIADNRELLIELDRQIGDADHGENMDRGFTAVVRGDGLESAKSGPETLKYVARTLLSTVGGAAGPLYGTVFLRASQEMPESGLTAADVAQMLESAGAGVQTRGKAAVGDKTMVDALIPAADAARSAAANGATVTDALIAAASAAEAGAQATKPMRAQKGRASYLGERSRGHIDPGATSTAMLLRAASDAAQTVFGSDTDE